MKRLFRYWDPLKWSVDTMGTLISVSEAQKVRTLPSLLASTIRAASCLRSSLGAFSMPPLSGCTVAASSRPWSCPTTAPMPSCAAASLLHHPSRSQGWDHLHQQAQALHRRGQIDAMAGWSPGAGTMAKPATTLPGGPPAPRQVTFSDPLVSTPSHQEQPS